MMWLRSERLQRLGGGWGEQAAIGCLAKIQFFMLGSHKEREILRLLRKVRRQRRCLLTGFEAYNVYSFARSRNHLAGDMAEVGVFEGASAKLICEARGERPVHLFDTFEGLPPSSGKDGNVYRNKKPLFKSSLESVKEYLKGYHGVACYKGRFPETAGPVADRTFSFVHLDVDLYQSTLDSLEFFYPRMTPGGLILSHDYSVLAGVRSAFTEFFEGRDEQIIELATSQCMVVRV